MALEALRYKGWSVCKATWPLKCNVSGCHAQILPPTHLLIPHPV